MLPIRVVCVLVGAFVLRMALIGWGAYQDATLPVPFTDIDYSVYTDAASLVWEHASSPYLRHTYRYTPLLAWLLTPNVFWFPAFGKVLFCAADIAIGWILFRMMVRKGLSANDALRWSGVWLFNPVTVTISSRGNADSLIVLTVIGMINALELGRPVVAGFLFGLAIHLKLYPIIFSLALLLHLLPPPPPMPPSEPKTCAATVWWATLVSRRGATAWRFTLATLGTLLATGFPLYQRYGWDFLYETYLYHLVRRDHRHNFSLYFYQIYLGFEEAGGSEGLLVLLPQVVLCLMFTLRFHRRLHLCLLLCTHAFVMFNKVVTAQYFIWYWSFLPLVLPDLKPGALRQGMWLAGAWLLTQGLWLGCGYLIEFKGRPAFLPMWVASILFFASNAAISLFLIRASPAAAVEGQEAVETTKRGSKQDVSPAATTTTRMRSKATKAD